MSMENAWNELVGYILRPLDRCEITRLDEIAAELKVKSPDHYAVGEMLSRILKFIKAVKEVVKE